MKKILVIIGGPTCIGKSKISIKLAKKFNSEIISSDSRQFYKELNIGVAKVPVNAGDPIRRDSTGIKHHQCKLAVIPAPTTCEPALYVVESVTVALL